MVPVVGILYLAACILCGIMGRHTAIGFVGHLVVAFFLSPVVDFLIQLAARPAGDIRKALAKARLNES